MDARIAIVDDDPAFSEYLATCLRTRGYDVRVHESGSDLLEALGRTPPPDVVLLDVLMPGMDGLETLRAARQVQPALQVIMLSGSSAPSNIVDAVRLGANDYVVKPDDPGGLGEAALEGAIRHAVEKLSLTTEVARLQAQASESLDGTQPCWGSGAAMRRVLTMVARVADSDVSVLLSGESGVGKEIIAHELHRQSPRRTQPFVKVNCAALPADLLESELFGHERGAFTGAQQVRVGRFEFAHGGTLLLDEIGEMPLTLQAKLLHVLEDGEVTRLGNNRPVTIDVRVVAATNRNLEEMIRLGTFREDLYYRLQVIEVRVPPLRDRQDEILPLTEFFLLRYALRYGRPAPRPSATLRAALREYPWPGNVRELENLIKRFVILQDENLVHSELTRALAAALPTTAEAVAAPTGISAPLAAVNDERPTPVVVPDEPGTSLPDLARRASLAAEREAIRRTLDRFRWNRRKAAERLGVSYKTLLNKMKECGISVNINPDSGTPAG